MMFVSGMCLGFAIGAVIGKIPGKGKEAWVSRSILASLIIGAIATI